MYIQNNCQIQFDFTEDFFIDDESAVHPTLFLALDIISNQKSSKVGASKNYKFCVLYPDKCRFLKIKIFRSSLDLILVKSVVLFDYANGRRLYSDFPPTEAQFLEEMKGCTQIDPSQVVLEEKETISASVPTSSAASVTIREWLKKHEIFSELIPDWLKSCGVIEKITCVEKVMELDYHMMVREIQAQKIGKVLSECAAIMVEHLTEDKDELKCKIAFRIAQLSSRLVSVMADHYFFKTPYQKDGPGLQKESVNGHRYKRAVRDVFEDLKSRYRTVSTGQTTVFAKDLRSGHLWVARSGRIWSLDWKTLHIWSRNKEVWKEHLSEQKLFFATLVSQVLTVDILAQVVSKYTRYCTLSNKVTSLVNLNRLKGHFSSKLWELHEMNPESRFYFLNRFRSYFSKALPEEKWKELFLLFEKPKITYLEVSNIVQSFKLTSNEGVFMFISAFTCGELKIALDCCREYPTLPPQEQSHLPKTLGERLQFAAFKMNNNQAEEIEICERCHEVWPACEALYWIIQESGLNLSILEDMDRLVRMTKKTEET